MAHLILGYTPLSSSFQVSKCVIKAKDPRLQQIDVTTLGFLNLSSGPRGVLKVEPIFQYKTEDAATPSQQATTEEEEKEEGGVVEVSDFEDDFEVFNQPQSLEEFTGDFSHLPLVDVTLLQGDLPILKAMGIQRKPKAVLLDVMESQSGSKAPKKTTQEKLPPPPSSLPPQLDLVDHKRKMD